jgi:WD40 repeat protein
MPGISPDGSTVLLDQGNQIKMVAIGDRQPRGVIENLSGALNFTTMAIFSPDSEMILTNCSEENRLQLWRAPTKGGRAAELRQFVWDGEGEGTCGAFDPQRRFAVTGTGDHQVLIWELPDQKEVNTILTGRVELVSQFIDSSSPQRLFRAKLDGRNPGYLLPGGTATIVKPAVTAGTQPVVGKITP